MKKKLHILVLSQIYLPEMGALSNRLYPIVWQLVEAGHAVSVATGMPNYPAGKVFEDYRGRFMFDEKAEGYKILRTNYFTTPRNRSKLKQLLSYISFMPAVFLSALRAGKCDVVFVTTPPIFPLLPAILVAKLRGAKLAFDVRDLWSDELVTFGDMSENSITVRVARKIENWGYRMAELVSATTKSLRETVIDRGAASQKAFYLPNGADTELFRTHPKLNDLTRKLDLGNRFVVMYSGLFGIKHGLETFLEAAEILREQKDIVFFLLGNGARRQEIEDFIKERSLENVLDGGEVGVKEVPLAIAAADVCYASFLKSSYTKKIVSVKVFEYMACEKPVVGAFEGESARIIKEAEAGLVVSPGDSKGITEAILKLKEDSVLRERMGRSGRNFVAENFSRAAWADRFEEKLAGLCDEPLEVPTGIERKNLGQRTS